MKLRTKAIIAAGIVFAATIRIDDAATYAILIGIVTCLVLVVSDLSERS